MSIHAISIRVAGGKRMLFVYVFGLAWGGVSVFAFLDGGLWVGCWVFLRFWRRNARFFTCVCVLAALCTIYRVKRHRVAKQKKIYARNKIKLKKRPRFIYNKKRLERNDEGNPHQSILVVWWVGVWHRISDHFHASHGTYMYACMWWARPAHDDVVRAGSIID